MVQVLFESYFVGTLNQQYFIRIVIDNANDMAYLYNNYYDQGIIYLSITHFQLPIV